MSNDNEETALESSPMVDLGVKRSSIHETQTRESSVQSIQNKRDLVKKVSSVHLLRKKKSSVTNIAHKDNDGKDLEEMVSSADEPNNRQLSVTSIGPRESSSKSEELHGQGSKSQSEKERTSAIASVIIGEEEQKEEHVENLVINKAKESREAKRERLKNARNIRFMVEDTTKENVANGDSGTGEAPTAISTPTRMSVPALEIEDIIKTDKCEEEEEVDETDETESEDHEGRNQDAAIEQILNQSGDEDEEQVEEFQQYEKIDSVEAKNVFLEEFEIPSISDISEDSDEILVPYLISKESVASSHISVVDKGKFVNPLTGESISSTSSTSSETSSASEEDSLHLDTVEVDDEHDRLQGEFNELAELKTVVVHIPNDEDIFVKFTKEFIAAPTAFDDEEDDTKRIYHQQAISITLDFMHELIASVVKAAEGDIAENHLKRLLDKRKLMDDLLKQWSLYLYEKDINAFLNNRTSEYYRRLRNTRPFVELPSSKLAVEQARYREALHSYDHYANVAALAKTKAAYFLGSVMMDLSYVDNISRQTEEHLETVMLSLLGKRSDYLYRVTERELRLMREKRNEISDSRLYLITRKHTLGKIKEKLAKLEKINDELVMDDFISIQNQVTALNKKIEERQHELKKLRGTYHNELHTAQHNRERTIALAINLKEHHRKLMNKLDIQRSLRERLYNAKMERGLLRKRHSDLTYQGGLLAMPALMLDYDETVDKVAAKQAVVNEMKETVARLTQRISEFETRRL